MRSLWEHTGSNRGPSACKADALNQLSYAPFSYVSVRRSANIGEEHYPKKFIPKKILNIFDRLIYRSRLINLNTQIFQCHQRYYKKKNPKKLFCRFSIFYFWCDFKYITFYISRLITVVLNDRTHSFNSFKGCFRRYFCNFVANLIWKLQNLLFRKTRKQT